MTLPRIRRWLCRIEARAGVRRSPRRGTALAWCLALALASAGCGAAADAGGAVSGADVTDDASEPALGDPGDFGPYAIGHVGLTLLDTSRNRSLPVEAWMPVQVSALGPDDVADFETGARRATLEALLAEAATCTTQGTRARPGGTLARARLPLIVMSHCHGCVRWWMFSVAEHLASQGFAVIGVDHTGNTVFDAVAGSMLPLNKDTLATRIADVRFVLDRVLAADPAFPAPLTAAIDAAHIGLIGHSFGAVTVGGVAQVDDRVRAVAALGAPMDNPLLPGVDAAAIHQPTLMALLVEDNSIGSIGNDFLQANYDELPGPAWLMRVADAGHFSLSDIAGLRPELSAGCGTATAMTTQKPMRYPAPSEIRAVIGTALAAFFRAHLNGEAAAAAWLAAPPTLPRVSWSQKPAP